MPLRKQILATGETYHVVNRGVASTPIFKSESEYQRFIELIDFYRFENSDISFSNFKKLQKDARINYMNNLKKQNIQRIKIYSYCLMPNHFHFLVRQTKNGGIKNSFSNIQNAYARYFNLKSERVGPLFQSRFRAARIESDEIFLHVSRYIHLNPSTSYLVDSKKLNSYEWSSYPEYLGLRDSLFTKTDDILITVGGVEKYQDFVLNQIDYQRELDRIKHFTLENK